MVGLSKGSVAFLEVDKIDQIYARFSVHNEAVTHICEIKEEGGIFVSICKACTIVTWNFQGSKFHQISSNQVFRPVITMKAIGSSLMMGFETGDVQLLYYSRLHHNIVFIKTSNRE